MKDEAAPPTQERCCHPALLQASKLKFLHRGAHSLQEAGQADKAFGWAWTKSHRPTSPRCLLGLWFLYRLGAELLLAL